MAQEDQTQKCSNSSSGGNITIGSNNSIRSSKKQKQKKAPQRGLGVAQLEKIRIEEQQRRDATAIFPSPTTISQSGSCYLPAPLINYHVQGDFAPPNSIIRPVPPHPVQNFEVLSAGAFPLVNRARGCGLEIDRPSGPEHFPYMWNFPEYGDEIKTSLVDPGSQLGSRPSLPIDSSWPSLGSVRKVQYDHPPLLVNASPVTSAPSLNYQMEPPSNQSHYGNYFPALPLEEKVIQMIGVKRPYPFSLENPPSPYYPFKLPVLGHPNSTPDEPYSRGIGNFSEGPSCPPPVLELNFSKSVKSSGTLGGEFLTLGPPATSTPPNSNQPPDLLTLNDQNVPGFESRAHKGFQEGLRFRQASNWRYQENPCYNFLPPAMVPNNQASTPMNNCNSDPGASIDLNLKL